jgi:hypothetical protein
MIVGDSGYVSIIDLLKNIDLAYAFKKKRLRHLSSASITAEILYLRDNFNSIWDKRGNLFYLKDPALSHKGREIIQGLFGDYDKALAILKINQALIALNRERVSEFMKLHIASTGAQRNLLAILFDGEDSLAGLVHKQIPYLERYISTIEKFSSRPVSEVVFSQSDLDNILHFLSGFDVIEENLTCDIQRFKEFERDFLRLYRENATIDVVGYGEISTVMRLKKEKHIHDDIVMSESLWIWKKMPPFPNKEEVDYFLKLYDKYRTILTEDIGITVPEQTARYFKHNTYFQVYAGQKRVNPEGICNTLIKKLDEPNANRLLCIILNKLRDVFIFNKAKNVMKIGIDAQLSNWALDPNDVMPAGVTGNEEIIYIDTSSPMMRIDGIEQINPEIFIKSAASFLRPVIRKFFLQEVLDRYYDMRLVVIDIIANLHKEKRKDLIDGFIKTTNEYFKNSGIEIKELTRKEIDTYYSNDAFIWKFYQASRKIDRFITENILRKKYMFRIPEKIER